MARSRVPCWSRASTASVWASADRKAQARAGNPSDNSLAVGPNHIVQTVNGAGMAVFTKKGKLFNETGRVLYGPVRVEQRLQGLRRQLRSPQQRRRRRALRPAGGSLADCACRCSRADRRGRTRLRPRRRASRNSACRASRINRGLRPCCTSRRLRRQLAQRLLHRRLPRQRTRRRRAASVHHSRPGLPARTPCATRSARRRIRSAPTTAMSSCVRSFPTIRAPRSGPTATTCRRARATTGSQRRSPPKSTRASPIARRC